MSPQPRRNPKAAPPVARKGPPRAAARPVGELIASVVREVGLHKGGKLDALEQAWREAVGREHATQTRLLRLRGGVLTIEVRSAALAHELEVYAKKALLVRLRETSKVALSDLRFKVGGGPSEPLSN